MFLSKENKGQLSHEMLTFLMLVEMSSQPKVPQNSASKITVIEKELIK